MKFALSSSLYGEVEANRLRLRHARAATSGSTHFGLSAHCISLADIGLTGQISSSNMDTSRYMNLGFIGLRAEVRLPFVLCKVVPTGCIILNTATTDHRRVVTPLLSISLLIIILNTSELFFRCT